MNTAITDATLSSDTIFATPVADEQRPGFWPQHFGTVPQWILLEPRIFAGWTVSARITAGYLEFYTLSNGGAFMAPCTDGDAQWQLFNSMNGNDAQTSAEAAGITVCLIEYSHHACRTGCDAMTAHFYRLREYALRHQECSAIMRIID